MGVSSQLDVGAPFPRALAVAIGEKVGDFRTLPKLIRVEKRAHDGGVARAERETEREWGGE